MSLRNEQWPKISFNNQLNVIEDSQHVHEVIIMQENFFGCACIQQPFQPKNVHRWQTTQYSECNETQPGNKNNKIRLLRHI